MPSAQVAIGVPIILAWVALVGTHALAMRRADDYRGSWGALFGASLPALFGALFLSTEPGVSVNIRNIIAGTIGGAVGISGGVWLAYLVSDWRANAQPPAPGGPPLTNNPSAPGPTFNVPGSGNIVTNNQSGGTNIINQAPPPQIKIASDTTTPNANGTFTQTIVIDVNADRVLPKLAIIAKNPNALEINVTGPPRFQILSGGGEGFVFYKFANAAGRYTVTVIKATAAPAEIAYEL